MTLGWVTQWFNIIYLLPLALALVYLGVYALSGWTFGDTDVDGDVDADADVHAEVDTDLDHDLDTDADVEADIDHEVAADHDAEAASGRPFAGAPEGIFSWLGVGRVPISLIGMLLFMSFGAIGFVVNQAARDFVVDASVLFLSLPAAATGALGVTRVVGRLVHRYMPMNESYAGHKRDFLGLTGEALFDINDTFGMVAVRDNCGNLMQLPCRVDPGRPGIRKGEVVTLVGYSPRNQTYTVIPDLAPLRPDDRPRGLESGRRKE